MVEMVCSYDGDDYNCNDKGGGIVVTIIMAVIGNNVGICDGEVG